MAADLLMVKVVTDNLEVSHNETEAKDLNTININFGIIDFREAHFNRIILNTATAANPTTRVAMEHINISITHMTHRQNSTAHLVVYAAVSIIPLSTVTKENMTLTILWKR